MKKWIKKIGALAVSAIMLTGAFGVTPVYAGAKDMRGAWISTVYSADYPSVINDAAGQKAEFIKKLDQLKAIGINMVLVQVRPKGDAFYQSELNPWSAVLTGEQGKNPGYDPMAFMIEEAHKRGMEFHAWMNPYRITTKGTDLAELSGDNMARKHPDWILTYNNAMYYNPEKAEVKQYIADTVTELVKNYEVDAIHFDDYFYPLNYPLKEGDNRDGAEANARRGHVNDMVRMVSEAIHAADSGVQFGISPMGIWKNSTSDSFGSGTKGAEGYYSVYGDAKTWVDQGWVDYITPQIYWETGNAFADYETLVKWWSDLVRGKGVNLYVGHGIYRDPIAGEIVTQMKINEKYNVDGSMFFSSRDLISDRGGSATALKAYYKGGATSKPETPTVIEKKKAYATRSKITVDGVSADLEVYIIDDYTYFKLRDIASAVDGTGKQFDPIWNESAGAINLHTGVAYTGTAGTGGGAGKNTTAITSTAKLTLNGEARKASAFVINDYTYYKLRDIGQLLDFGVTWSEGTGAIGIDTSVGYES